MAKAPLSILIPIKNEASNLPRCLASVVWADEVFVVDSDSTDGSQQIVRDHGAQLVRFQFNGTWPKKKNWALENLPFKHEWVFILDADEVLPPETELEFRAIVSDPAHPLTGYWINRRFMFMGKWLKHAYYPNWNLRLFKHRLGRYEKLTDVDTQSGDNEVHEHVMVQGETGRLRCEMDHYAFPSVGVFVEKHNRYSNWEACVALDHYLHASGKRLQKSEVGTRRKLKRFSQALPCRGLLRFLYVYIWQRGFLDGREGYYFARLHGFYEFLSVAKTYELKRLTLRQSRGETGSGPGAGPIVMAPSALRRCGSLILPWLFFGALAAVLYFALIPNVNHDVFRILPAPLQRWCGVHDDLNNFAAFAVLGLLGFLLGSKVRPRFGAAKRGPWTAAVANSRLCLIALLALVCALEVAQIWIPGRNSCLRDVATGWAGVLTAWIFYAGLSRRA
jgi:glycosyltransferase involved in cell wall biosynthesis/VanZ family protein